jgi:hypothetical protein
MYAAITSKRKQIVNRKNLRSLKIALRSLMVNEASPKLRSFTSALEIIGVKGVIEQCKALFVERDDNKWHTAL